ncbi:MFS transporter [Nakamurella sp. YIM 132087]|uniref:MFS transporter n=2 Tax=Nakamurella alba TaxID=2665158 RepID=A0A7K1FL18_9ACTN|nr:MFS transporter [Nakamurella alba]
MPVIALTAADLGGSVGTAAFVVALLGIGLVLADLPAGAIAARFGEKTTLLLASALEFVGGLGALLAKNVAVLGASILLVGFSAAAFGLARQSYLTAAVPVDLRARALSTLGGVYRIGMFLGPFVGALVISHTGIQGAYLVDMVASVGAFLLVLFSRDITADAPGDPARAVAAVPEKPEPVLRALFRHRRILGTLGVGVLFLSVSRACRMAIVPLWAASIGLDAAHASLVFGIAGAADMLLFYPAGALMDRKGRLVVAFPSMIILGVGMILVVFTSGFTSLLLVAMLLGFGNGIGAGLIMTLGADAAPAVGRPQFLAGWRLMSDAGNAAGPLLISGIALFAPLAAASIVIAVISFVGAEWLRHWIPRYDPVSAATLGRRRAD